MKAMTISQAARAAGVGVETVRFYERRNLIVRPSKPPDGGFRRYPPETIERIRFIRQAQGLGFSLREIEELLSLRADPAQAVSAIITSRREILKIMTQGVNRLAETAQRHHVSATMSSRPGHRIRVLALTLLLALGMSLSFVQGGLMAAEMAISAEAGAAGPSGCEGCSGGDDGTPDAGICLSVCGSAAQGMPPGEPVALPATPKESIQAAHLLLGGRSHSPDHGPPKILTLG